MRSNGSVIFSAAMASTRRTAPHSLTSPARSSWYPWETARVTIIEIGASTVVIWELSGSGEERQQRGLRVIGYAFAALAIYLLVQSTVVLAIGYRPQHSVLGIVWPAVTAAAMFTLAAGKARTGRVLDNPG